MRRSPISRRFNLRWQGLLAAVCPVWFASVYAVFSIINDGFSHRSHPVSGLGAIGEPRAWAWNLLGFIIPGAVVAALGVAIRRSMADSRAASLAGFALLVSGVLLACAGLFPADLSGERVLLNQFHSVSGWGSFSAFLVAGSLIPAAVWRRTRSWSMLLIPLSLVAGALICFGLVLPDLWGPLQRLGFLCFFLWVGVMGLVILRVAETGGSLVDEQPVGIPTVDWAVDIDRSGPPTLINAAAEQY